MLFCQLAVKRGLDIALAVVIIIILSPILTIAAVVVIRHYPGRPVLYYDWRAGKRGKPFKCRKLRTLPVGYDPLVRGAMPVPTSIKWIRRIGIDETPQLVAILMGKMSFCGNRALLAKEADLRYGAAVQAVLVMRPGLVSLLALGIHSDNVNSFSPVSHTFDATATREALEYVTKWSLRKDWKIIRSAMALFWSFIF